MKQRIYLENFSEWDDGESWGSSVCGNFRVNGLPEPKYVYAVYDTPPYEGYAVVVFSDDMETFGVVEGSHCSCYGLEDQWDPTYHSKEEILKMCGEDNWRSASLGGQAQGIKQWLNSQ